MVAHIIAGGNKPVVETLQRRGLLARYAKWSGDDAPPSLLNNRALRHDFACLALVEPFSNLCYSLLVGVARYTSDDIEVGNLVFESQNLCFEICVFMLQGTISVTPTIRTGIRGATSSAISREH